KMAFSEEEALFYNTLKEYSKRRLRNLIFNINLISFSVLEPEFKRKLRLLVMQNMLSLLHNLRMACDPLIVIDKIPRTTVMSLKGATEALKTRQLDDCPVCFKDDATVHNELIIANVYWNMAKLSQISDCIHRIGQTGLVTVFCLYIKDTIEMKLKELVEKKDVVCQILVDGKALTATNESWISRQHVLTISALPDEPSLIARLRPAQTLTAAGIDNIVWGEDALAYAYGVPTLVLDTLHIVVEPHRALTAATILMKSYRLCFSHNTRNDIVTSYPDSILLGTHQFPDDIDNRLSAKWILITPATFLHYDLRNFVTLEPLLKLDSLNLVRFPTLASFLDSSLTVGSSPSQQPSVRRQHFAYSGYLSSYPFRQYYKKRFPDVDSLPNDIRSVAEQLQERHRPLLYELFVGDPYEDGSDDECDD
ncbi:hypothetical protein HK097_009989, partial [Rhizophlyctis rosea]